MRPDTATPMLRLVSVLTVFASIAYTTMVMATVFYLLSPLFGRMIGTAGE